MDARILENYVGKVYGWAIKHTFSTDEADELSQEIFLNALKSLPRLRDENRFEPWLWGIAKNVERGFRRHRGKERGIVSFDEIAEIPILDTDLSDEFDDLRLHISRLSAIYRDIIVLYYYDSLSTKEIAKRLCLPEGTVTWRLSEARKKLKKESEIMEEAALRPQKLRLDIYGSGNYPAGGPFPNEFINDALSQNILINAYRRPISVEELSALCGVPAYYIEDRLDNLKKRGAVIETPTSKYQTDLAIIEDKHGIYVEENAKTAVTRLSDRVFSALEGLAKDMENVKHYRAELSDLELFYLYGVMAFAYLSRIYCKMEYPSIPTSYDGNNWRYIGHTDNAHPLRSLGSQNNSNSGSRGHYSCSQYNFASFSYRRMIYDLEINICEDLILTGSTEDKYDLASCIAEGYVKKDGEKLISTIPAFTKSEYESFCKLTEKHFASIVPDWNSMAVDFADGYCRLFPKHLHDDALRLSRYFWFALFGSLCESWQEDRLEKPPVGSFCAVMIEN